MEEEEKNWIMVKEIILSHDKLSKQIDINPKGDKIASTSIHNVNIMIYDADFGNLETTLEGHTKPISVLKYSPDGKKIASGSMFYSDFNDENDDGSVKIWDVSSGRLLHSLAVDSDVLSIAWSPDSKKIVSLGRKENSIQIWNVSSGKLENTFECLKQPGPVIWSPDGTKIASVDKTYAINIWNANSGILEKKTVIGKTITSLAFSHDSKKIVSASYDRTIKIWDASSGIIEKTFMKTRAVANLVTFSPDDKHVISNDGTKEILGENDDVDAWKGLSTYTIDIWNVDSGEREKNFTHESYTAGPSSILKSAINQNQDKIVVSTGNIIIWKLMSQSLINEYKKKLRDEKLDKFKRQLKSFNIKNKCKIEKDDPITLTPLRKRKTLKLSDRRCYDIESMAAFHKHHTNNSPFTRAQFTDEDREKMNNSAMYLEYLDYLEKLKEEKKLQTSSARGSSRNSARGNSRNSARGGRKTKHRKYT
jgi:WD40 repeat protein